MGQETETGKDEKPGVGETENSDHLVDMPPEATEIAARHAADNQEPKFIRVADQVKVITQPSDNPIDPNFTPTVLTEGFTSQYVLADDVGSLQVLYCSNIAILLLIIFYYYEFMFNIYHILVHPSNSNVRAICRSHIDIELGLPDVCDWVKLTLE